ncbi:hypothetical protein AB3A00_003306 [Vibrio cholerae]|nr:hypothetical protein [Vibrio cholerae]EJV3738626.1 hypothetical protein [Vibrio cholerae]EKF9216439.1 hypothetical protein [Vibrio cholerae]
MLRRVTLEPDEKYFFDVGRNSEVLILREATQNITLTGDAISPIEIAKCDVVNVVKYRSMPLYFHNRKAERVTVEFQLSDTPIMIREQIAAINGSSLVIDEITKAVSVSEIKAPISIHGVVPVRMEGGIAIGEVTVKGAVSTKDNLEGLLTQEKRFTASSSQYVAPVGHVVRSMMLQAGLSNTESVFFKGFELPAGAVMRFDYPQYGAVSLSLNSSNIVNAIFLLEPVT